MEAFEEVFLHRKPEDRFINLVTVISGLDMVFIKAPFPMPGIKPSQMPDARGAAADGFVSSR
jgi:hypothetical protein